jgi:hypothetical protein
MKRVSSVTLSALAVVLLSTGSAHAYLDPGLGSMLLQGLVAGVAAGSVVLSRYWHRIKAYFSSQAPRERTAHGAADPADK